MVWKLLISGAAGCAIVASAEKGEDTGLLAGEGATVGNTGVRERASLSRGET